MEDQRSHNKVPDGVDNHRKGNNYCYNCKRKLNNWEKGKSTDAKFKHPICIDCAYELAYKYIGLQGFPNEEEQKE